MSSPDTSTKDEGSLTVTSLNVVSCCYYSNQKAPLEERVAFAGYSIPTWSHLPGCEYGFDVVKKGIFIEHMSISNQPILLVGKVFYR